MDCGLDCGSIGPCGDLSPCPVPLPECGFPGGRGGRLKSTGCVKLWCLYHYPVCTQRQCVCCTGGRQTGKVEVWFL